jgi:hypothetical protein
VSSVTDHRIKPPGDGWEVEYKTHDEFDDYPVEYSVRVDFDCYDGNASVELETASFPTVAESEAATLAEVRKLRDALTKMLVEAGEES